jgi:hypothetical protein
MRKPMLCQQSAESGLSVLFLSEVSCPLKFARISPQEQGTLSALAGAEPKYRSVILDEHHASARWEFAATK